MPVESLVDLPTLNFVFLDSDVLIYALTGVSRQCEDLLDRCQREEVTGIVLYETVNEVTHRLMVAEARSRGAITSGGARALRQNFRLIPTLRDYWNDTLRLLSLNLLFLPVSESVLRSAQTGRQAAGLLTNDSLIVSCLREFGVSFLATNDSDFERVVGITVYQPTDLPRRAWNFGIRGQHCEGLHQRGVVVPNSSPAGLRSSPGNALYHARRACQDKGMSRETEALLEAFEHLLQKANALSVAIIPEGHDISHLPGWVKASRQTADDHLLQLAGSNGAVLATLDVKIPGAYLIPQRRWVPKGRIFPRGRY